MRILCVHQGWELYGSDRTFINSVRALRASQPTAEIAIDLPRSGPLVARLTEFADSIHLRDMSVLRRRRPLAWVGFIAKLPINLYRASRRMNGFDIVYINTIVPIDYVLGTRFTSTRSLIHVHEIPRYSEQKILSSLLRASRATYLFNSQATRRSYALPETAASMVVYNGTVVPKQSILERSLDDTLHVLCIGRFNAWKGQEVLIAAVRLLSPQDRRRIQMRLVGDSFEGQTRYLDTLRKSLAEESNEFKATIEPFTDEPSDHYEWSDVVVIPSTRPEPFGMVAIEAMAAGRPVIATNHGGIVEVVSEAETGYLVEPDNALALGVAISEYLNSPELISKHGNLARERVRTEFSLSSYESRISIAVLESVHRPGSRTPPGNKRN